MDQRHTFWLKCVVYLFEKGGILWLADMFHHAHRHDAFKVVRHRAVILQAKRHPVGKAQVFCALAGGVQLYLRQRHPCDMHIMTNGKPHGQPAPTAANVQDPHAWTQAKLGRDMVHLGNLRLFKT